LARVLIVVAPTTSWISTCGPHPALHALVPSATPGVYT